MAWGGLDESEREVDDVFCAGASMYAISVGTLSDVIPRSSMHKYWARNGGSNWKAYRFHRAKS